MVEWWWFEDSDEVEADADAETAFGRDEVGGPLGGWSVKFCIIYTLTKFNH